jgi:hypothetical protein
MLFSCSLTCVGVLAALLLARKSVFTDDDVGGLVRFLDAHLPGPRWANKKLKAELKKAELKVGSAASS